MVPGALRARRHRRDRDGAGRSRIGRLDDTDATGKPPMSERPIIAARGVTRRFGGLLALDRIDLAIPRGIVQAIIGPNGSGKTTLFNALCGAPPAEAGSIPLAGPELVRLRPHCNPPLGRVRP